MKVDDPVKSMGKGVTLLSGFALLVVLVVAFIAHTYGLRLDQVYALRGFSVLEVVEAHANPAAFARDYPGGARMTTAESPLVNIYFFLHDWFGISALAVNYAMIFVELLFVAGGSYVLWSALAKQSSEDPASDHLHWWMFVCLLALLLVSDIQRPNLAAFGFPFFHGQFYGFADGLRLAGIGLVLRYRWIASAIVLSLCFIIHPIKALVGMAFLVPVLMLDWRSLLTMRCLISILATLAISTAWYAMVLSGGENGVPLREFVDYTRLLQSHWYPLETGVLGTRHEAYLSSFMALTLMCLAALGHTGWSRRLQLKMGLGVVTLLVVTALGIWISHDARSATLIRICLIRASTLITLLAPFILMSSAMTAWRHQLWMIAAACLAFQATAFFGPEDMAPLFAVFFAFLCLKDSDNGKAAHWLVIGVALAVAGVSVWLWQSYPRTDDPVSAALPVLMATAVFWGLFFRLPILGQRKCEMSRLGSLVPALVAGVFLTLGVVWTSDELRRITKSEAEAQAYLETQLWARHNTSSGSLFMVDPCRWYGWRDFSGRASIGTVREWFMTGWIYTNGNSALEKGEKISRMLGLDMRQFLGRGYSSDTRRDMCAAARAEYYAPDMRGAKAVREEFGVDFFVYELDHAGSSADVYAADFAFKNSHFAILPAGKLR